MRMAGLRKSAVVVAAWISLAMPWQAKAQAHKGRAETQLEFVVTTQRGDKPVGNASVYVRFPGKNGKLIELDLKTNEDGRVKGPKIPQGKIMVQVVAEGKKTFGQWFDIEEEQKTIAIQLEPPAHWY